MSRALFFVIAAIFAALPAFAQDWPSEAGALHRAVPAGRLGRSARAPARRQAGRPAQASSSSSRTAPGAGGSIGTAAAAKAPADGYTFVVVFDSHAVNQALISKLPYDTAKDFAPVMLVGTAPYAIATQAGEALEDRSPTWWPPRRRSPIR